MVATVDPGWIESAASHLVKRVYTEPQWVRARGFVSAYETVTLYGLTLASRRRVNYANIAPVEAREIFVREALVNGNSEVSGDFLPANRRLIAEIEQLEKRASVAVTSSSTKLRWLTSTSRVLQGVSTVAAFESWRIKAERREPQLLHMARADVMEREAPEASSDNFLETLNIGGNSLPLIYKFEPTMADDGVTLKCRNRSSTCWMQNASRGWSRDVAREDHRDSSLAAEVGAQAIRTRARLSARDSSRRRRRGTTQRYPSFHEWLAQIVTRQAGETVTAAAELASLALARLSANERSCARCKR